MGFRWAPWDKLSSAPAVPCTAGVKDPKELVDWPPHCIDEETEAQREDELAQGQTATQRQSLLEPELLQNIGQVVPCARAPGWGAGGA